MTALAYTVSVTEGWIDAFIVLYRVFVQDDIISSRGSRSSSGITITTINITIINILLIWFIYIRFGINRNILFKILGKISITGSSSRIQFNIIRFR